MGKMVSKVAGGGGMHSSSRRRGSQNMGQPNVVNAPEPPRMVPETTDRAILTLKLQRDELTVYKGRANVLLRKEDETIKRLLKEGKTERAKLLLKKKRFQEHILQETEKKLNLILNQATGQASLSELRQEVDETIVTNGDAMKRLHLLVSLENAEWMLKETNEGSKKQTEVGRLLQLATLGEHELLDKDVDAEIQKLAVTLGLAADSAVVAAAPVAAPQEDEKSPAETDEPAAATEVATDEVPKEEEVNELEELITQKLKENKESQEAIDADLSHKPDVVQDSEIEDEKSPDEAVAASSELPVAEAVDENDKVVDNATSSLSELAPVNAHADDEKNSSESPSVVPFAQETAEISKLLPDVPSSPIDATNNDDHLIAEQAEPIALADADNV